MRVIICDIDGTLADISHRRHFVASKPKNWRAFNAAMSSDKLNGDIAWLIRCLWLPMSDDHNEKTSIVLASGRGEEDRRVTTDWLVSHKIYPEAKDRFPEYPLFTYERLYMRPAGDNRSDVVVKREILDQIRADGYDPVMAVDDRDGVVAMWRENGIRCLQVAPGDF